jgi:hypothetical protein
VRAPTEKGVLEFLGFCNRAKAGDTYTYYSGHLAHDCEVTTALSGDIRELDILLCRLRAAAYTYYELGFVSLAQQRVQHMSREQPPIWNYVATRSDKPLINAPTFSDLVQS